MDIGCSSTYASLRKGIKMRIRRKGVKQRSADGCTGLNGPFLTPETGLNEQRGKYYLFCLI